MMCFGSDEVEAVIYIHIHTLLPVCHECVCPQRPSIYHPNEEGDLLLPSSKPVPGYISVILGY